MKKIVLAFAVIAALTGVGAPAQAGLGPVMCHRVDSANYSCHRFYRDVIGTECMISWGMQGGTGYADAYCY